MSETRGPRWLDPIPTTPLASVAVALLLLAVAAMFLYSQTAARAYESRG